ncbi:MAG TPA: glycosyltransferase family protein [Blastocatellia bacterium]|nr:glycosyltransferase family protein [Blastocatellia bacterium]
MKLVVVIQARTGSTRTPNKVMMPLAGAPLLQRLTERVLAAKTDFALVIATTTNPQDDPIRQLCLKMNVKCFSGHPTDLLDRHYQAALAEGANAVAKIPSDCPLIDPAIIDKVLNRFVAADGQADYVSNLHPATYPDGNDVEVMTMSALRTAWLEAVRPFEREHTTPFIWERPDRFLIQNVTWETNLDYSMSHRWTIDYPEDYRFINAVYNRLWSEDRPIFSIDDILTLLKRRPELGAINAKYAGVNWYRHHLAELRTISPMDTRTLARA